MIVRNGGPCRLLVAALLAAMIALRLWDPAFLRALRFAVLGRMDAWLPSVPMRPPWAVAAEIAAAAAGAALIGWLGPRLRPVQAGAIPGGLAAAAIVGGVGVAAIRFGLLLDPTWPLLAVIVIAGGAAFFLSRQDERTRQIEERKRQEVRVAFGHSLPPAAIDALAVAPALVSLDGARREITAVSVQIRDAGAVLAPMPPSEAAGFLRKIQDEITAIVHEHGGMVDRRTGEETLALFNAPLDDPAHADQAARAAAKIGSALDPLNAGRRAAAEAAGQKYIRVHLDIGIDTGPCTVGNLISDRHPAWTAMGPAIATATAIAPVAREYGVGNIIGDGTVEHMADPHVLELDLVRPGKRTKPVRVFTLLQPFVADTATAARLAATHARMVSAYRNRDWAEAETALRE